jgi:hypothetical protein
VKRFTNSYGDQIDICNSHMRAALSIVVACAVVPALVVAAGDHGSLRATVVADTVKDSVEEHAMGARLLPSSCRVYGWGRSKSNELLQPPGSEQTKVSMSNFKAG